jgi:hypothetical protein
MSDNFEFTINTDDVIFILTPTIFNSEERTGNMIIKMVILEELNNVNLDDLSIILKAIKIEKIQIFSINKNLDFNVNHTISNKGSKVNYIELNREQFVKCINSVNFNFLDYNPYSLYIMRDGDFTGIKNLFKFINVCPVDIGRGGSRSQKSHMLSPLDIRLSSYIMAMFNFDNKLINNLNTFNYINKDKYLSFQDKKNMYPHIRKHYSSKIYI